MQQIRSRGFTLLEVLIILVFFGVLAVISMGLLLQSLRRAALRQAESAFLAHLEKTRSTVFKTNQAGQIRLHADGKGYFLENAEDGVKHVKLASSMRILFKYANGASLEQIKYFPPYAEVSAVNSIVELSDGRDSRTLYVLGVTGKAVRQ